MIGGMSGSGGLELPSAMRIVGGVLLTLALAVGGIVALRRVLLKTDSRWTSPGIRLLGKAIVTPSLRAHLLEVDASRILVVEGRSGIGMTVLPRQDVGGSD